MLAILLTACSLLGLSGAVLAEEAAPATAAVADAATAVAEAAPAEVKAEVKLPEYLFIAFQATFAGGTVVHTNACSNLEATSGAALAFLNTLFATAAAASSVRC